MSDPVSRARRGALNAPRDIREMFGRITKRYDLVNRLMTGGMDRRWRRQVASLALAAAPAERPPRILDVATGTGDLALTLADVGAARKAVVVGLDFVGPMIAAAVAKRGARSLAPRRGLARHRSATSPGGGLTCRASAPGSS